MAAVATEDTTEAHRSLVGLPKLQGKRNLNLGSLGLKSAPVLLSQLSKIKCQEKWGAGKQKWRRKFQKARKDESSKSVPNSSADCRGHGLADFFFPVNTFGFVDPMVSVNYFLMQKQPETMHE